MEDSFVILDSYFASSKNTCLGEVIKKIRKGKRTRREEVPKYVLDLYFHDAGFKALMSCFINTTSKLQKN